MSTSWRIPRQHFEHNWARPNLTCSASSNHENNIHKLTKYYSTTNILPPENYPLYCRILELYTNGLFNITFLPGWVGLSTMDPNTTHPLSCSSTHSLITLRCIQDRIRLAPPTFTNSSRFRREVDKIEIMSIHSGHIVSTSGVMSWGGQSLKYKRS